MAELGVLQMQSQLTRYLDNQISLGDFEAWFVANSWDLENTGNRAAHDLAAEIDLALIERSNGHWTEDELREVLRGLSRTVVLDPRMVHGLMNDAVIVLQGLHPFPYLSVDTALSTALA